jgi:hypothetical protein
MELLLWPSAMMETLKMETVAPAIVRYSQNIDVQQTAAYLLQSASSSPLI